jgi:hypothetical protein
LSGFISRTTPSREREEAGAIPNPAHAAIAAPFAAEVKTRLTWERMTRIADAWLLPARTLHPYPEERFAALVQAENRMR